MTKAWNDKRVLVVGGSAGLGFHLAAAALRGGTRSQSSDVIQLDWTRPCDDSRQPTISCAALSPM